jgi:DNA-binding transcriptional LysR family regulator
MWLMHLAQLDKSERVDQGQNWTIYPPPAPARLLQADCASEQEARGRAGAEHLSFRAAAAQLGVTSSALSHSIRQLEERLGARLLHRTIRSVSLTDTGNRLLERLRPGMAQISGALEELKGERDRPSGRLRIYAQPWAVPTMTRNLSGFHGAPRPIIMTD